MREAGEGRQGSLREGLFARAWALQSRIQMDGFGFRDFAGVAELVDAVALGATVLGRAGSSPVPGTGSSPCGRRGRVQVCLLGASVQATLMRGEPLSRISSSVLDRPDEWFSGMRTQAGPWAVFI